MLFSTRCRTINVMAAWKEFEKFVARIETALAPRGAVVTWNDGIRDLDTGELRQLDATLRYKIGSCPVLIVFECRKRAEDQDVTWIEQADSKRRSVGADVIVLVSSSGFFEPAIVKSAKWPAIQLRTLADQDADKFASWVQVNEGVVIEDEYSLAELEIETWGESETVTFDSSAAAQIRERGSKATIFTRAGDGATLSIDQIVQEARSRRGPSQLDNLPEDGTKTRRTYVESFKQSQISIGTTEGTQDVKQIKFSLDWTRRRKFMPVTRTAEYAGPQSGVVQVAEWQVAPGVTFGFYHDVQTGVIHAGAQVEGGPSKNVKLLPPVRKPDG